MKKFEYGYLWLKWNQDINKELNEMGAEGWEAYAVNPDTKGYIYIYLKRELTQKED